MKQSSFLLKKIKYILLLSFLLIITFQSCEKDALEPIDFSEKLSDYNIYQGDLSDLNSTDEYHLYELSSPFFSDYAEKQRLIKIPDGSIMTATDDELLDFPNGTIIVKTFYYFNDKRDETQGKQIIETRLLIKSNDDWQTATYLWNDDQTEANLISAGVDKAVSWIDNTGEGKAVFYHVPSNSECATCHQSKEKLTPIGPKVRHLNMDVIRNNTTQNQLIHLQSKGVLNSFNPTDFGTTPNYNDVNLTIEERGRAYLDINCAACHTEDGFAGIEEEFRFSYTETLESSKILEGKRTIVEQMEIGEMPQSGAALVHEEGLELIKEFIESL